MRLWKPMRAILVFVLVLAACSNQPAATSPTPPTTSPTPTPIPPTTSATPSATPSPSPITLPSIAQLSAPSGTVVWALVAGTRLFRSSDRGDTWTEGSLPAGVLNAEVSFADDTNGLLLSAPSAAPDCQSQTVSLFKTTDGTKSWQKLAASGITNDFCKRFPASVDATHAYLAANKPGTNAVIYRTADGGASWTASAPLPIPPSLANQQTSISVTGRPRAFGSVVLVDGAGGQQTKAIFRSTDGGATFSYASTAPSFSPVAYVTATRWVLIGPPGQSMETTDGGVSWHAFTTDYSQGAGIAPDIAFGDASVGYATVRGAIQRTTDGGAHWTTIKTPGTG